MSGELALISTIDPSLGLSVASRALYDDNGPKKDITSPNLSHVVSVGVSLPKMDAFRSLINVIEVVDVLDQPEQVLIDSPYLTALDRCLSSPDRGELVINCVQGQSRSVFGAAYCLLRKANHTASSAMELIAEKREGIAVNPGFLSQLLLLERLLVERQKKYEDEDRKKVHCKVCSTRIPAVERCSSRESLLYNGEYVIDPEVLEGPFHDASNAWVREHCDDFWRDYVPRLESKAKKTKGKGKRKRGEKVTGQTEEEVALFNEPVLTPLSGGCQDFYYLPLRSCDEAERASPAAIYCEKCQASLGFAGVQLGICGNYILSAALAFRKTSTFIT